MKLSKIRYSARHLITNFKRQNIVLCMESDSNCKVFYQSATYHMVVSLKACGTVQHGGQTESLWHRTTWWSDWKLVAPYHMVVRLKACGTVPHGGQTESLWHRTTWWSDWKLVAPYHMVVRLKACGSVQHDGQFESLWHRTTWWSDWKLVAPYHMVVRLKACGTVPHGGQTESLWHGKHGRHRTWSSVRSKCTYSWSVETKFNFLLLLKVTTADKS